MMKKSKLLICMLFMSMILTTIPGMESRAEESDGGTTSADSAIQDENPQRLEEVTAMDEDGSIYEITDENGIVETDEVNSQIAMFSSRSASVKVVNFNTKGNKETYYEDETNGGEGYTNGAYGADAAYLGTTSDSRIRFMLSGVTGTVDSSDVQLLNYEDVCDHVSYYKVSDGQLIHYISQNLTKAVSSRLNNGTAPSYLKEGTKYYSYDGTYFYTDYAVMISDYQSGKTGASAVNKGNPFKNNYQFLDMRSTTDYTADEMEQILSTAMKNAGIDTAASLLTGSAESFVKYGKSSNVNALICAAVAINESGWGTSNIAVSKNNLFGLNAIDSSAAESAYVYNSIDDCIRDFMTNWMAGRYLGNNWRNHGEWLGNKGSGINVSYASDPYWGEKAAAIVWNLDAIGKSLTADADKTDDAFSNNTEETKPSTGGTEETKPSTDGTEEKKPSTGGTEETKPSISVAEGTESAAGTSNVGSTKPDSNSDKQSADDKGNNSEKAASETAKGDTLEERNLTDQDGIASVSALLSDNASLVVNPVSTDTDRYQSLIKVDEISGTTILGAYDVTLTGTMEGQAQLTFTVGEKYNGKKVTVLHYTDDSEKVYDSYCAEVVNGKITITVTGFSPFVLAIDNDTNLTDTAAVSPKTADHANIIIWTVLCLLSFISIIILRNRNKILMKR